MTIMDTALPITMPFTMEEAVVSAQEYVKGIDMSKWNNLGTPYMPKTGDWNKAVGHGVKFAYIRAGSIDGVTGEVYRDYVYTQHAQGAESVNVPYGFYWYFRPNFSATKQAEFFCSLIEKFEFTLPPCIDVEVPGAQYGISKATYAQYFLEFVNIVEARFHLIPMVYAGQLKWDNNVIQGNWKRYGLWVPRYNYVITSPWSDGKYVFRDWDNWTLWQHSADGNQIAETYGFWKPGCEFAARDLELDRFNGNLDMFNEYIASLKQNNPQPATQKEWIPKCLYPWMKELGYTGFEPPLE
jgi:GH25 family lysozyme M1 (1,4-beta-N-acetylmuramidase)